MGKRHRQKETWISARGRLSGSQQAPMSDFMKVHMRMAAPDGSASSIPGVERASRWRRRGEAAG